MGDLVSALGADALPARSGRQRSAHPASSLPAPAGAGSVTSGHRCHHLSAHAANTGCRGDDRLGTAVVGRSNPASRMCPGSTDRRGMPSAPVQCRRRSVGLPRCLPRKGPFPAAGKARRRSTRRRPSGPVRVPVPAARPRPVPCPVWRSGGTAPGRSAGTCPPCPAPGRRVPANVEWRLSSHLCMFNSRANGETAGGQGVTILFGMSYNFMIHEALRHSAA